MRHLFLLFLLPGFLFVSCDDDDDSDDMPDPVVIDSSQPVGAFTVTRSGAFVDQGGNGTMGTAEVGTDSEGTQFLYFNEGFATNLATGTVTVFFSTSEMYVADPGNGNPELELVGTVANNGEVFYKVEPAVGTEFDHVILWCASASVPFGYAPLQ